MTEHAILFEICRRLLKGEVLVTRSAWCGREGERWVTRDARGHVIWSPEVDPQPFGTDRASQDYSAFGAARAFLAVVNQGDLKRLMSEPHARRR